MKTEYSRPRELSAGEVVRLLRAKLKWLVLWGLMAGLAAGLATAHFIPPAYRAGTTLYVYASRQNDGSVSGSELAAAQSLAVIYGQMLQSQRVLSAVCDHLNGVVEAGELNDMVEITVADDAPLLRIEAVTADPGLSRDIAAAFAAVGPGELDRVTKVGGMELLEEARLPDKPEASGALKNGMFALAAGMTAAAVWFVLGLIFDSTIRTAADVTAHTVLPVLGETPAVDRDTKRKWGTRREREAWRLLAGSLMLRQPGAECRVFLVTGPGAGGDKCQTAAELAAGFAMLGRRTLLVDCDMRNPRQYRLWDVKNRGGLRNLLAKDGKCEVQRVAGLPLWVMPAGGGAAEPARLLASRRFEEAVRSLRAHYDEIILDAPPVEGCADARLAARCADGVILVARAGKTRRKALLDAAGAMDHTPICGVVVSGVKEKPGFRSE